MIYLHVFFCYVIIMLINVSKKIITPISSLFILLLCFSKENDTGKENNDFDRVDMACG